MKQIMMAENELDHQKTEEEIKETEDIFAQIDKISHD